MKDICVREMSKLPVDMARSPSTFIEVCFKYEGLPESKDATQLKTKEPEDTTMDVAGDAEAEGTYILVTPFIFGAILWPHSMFCEHKSPLPLQIVFTLG